MFIRRYFLSDKSAMFGDLIEFHCICLSKGACPLVPIDFSQIMKEI